MADSIKYDSSLKSLVVPNAVSIDGKNYDLTIRLRVSGNELNETGYKAHLDDNFLKWFQVDRVNEIAQNCFKSINASHKSYYGSQIKSITQIGIRVERIDDDTIQARAIIAKEGSSGFEALKNGRVQDIEETIEEGGFDSKELHVIYNEFFRDSEGVSGLVDIEAVDSEDEKTPEIDELDESGTTAPLTLLGGPYHLNPNQKKWLRTKYNEWKKTHERWLYSQRPVLSWFWSSVWDKIDFDKKDPYRPETFTEGEQQAVREVVRVWKEKAEKEQEKQEGFASFFEGFTEEDIQEFLGYDDRAASKFKALPVAEIIEGCLVKPLFDQWFPPASH